MRTLIPHLQLSSTSSLSDLAPAWWPIDADKFLCWAHLPFPSIITATWFGISSSRSSSGNGSSSATAFPSLCSLTATLGTVVVRDLWGLREWSVGWVWVWEKGYCDCCALVLEEHEGLGLRWTGRLKDSIVVVAATSCSLFEVSLPRALTSKLERCTVHLCCGLVCELWLLSAYLIAKVDKPIEDVVVFHTCMLLPASISFCSKVSMFRVQLLWSKV